MLKFWNKKITVEEVGEALRVLLAIEKLQDMHDKMRPNMYEDPKEFVLWEMQSENLNNSRREADIRYRRLKQLLYMQEVY